MINPVLDRKKLNGELVWCLRGNHFVHKGVSYTITATEITGRGIYEVNHTIRNDETGVTATMPVMKLVKTLIDEGE